MKKLLITALLGLLCLSAPAQNYSDNVTFAGQEGDVICLTAEASASKKKEAEDLALRSALNALMYTGIDGLHNGQPMLTSKSKDYDYRFFNEQRYLHYLTDKPKTTSKQKAANNVRAHVVVYLNVKGLQKEFQRNQLPLSPAWADSKAVKATASLNPTIVVVPATTSEDGYDFEAMRSMMENDPAQSFAVYRVAEEFQKHGYKTRDFMSMLKNSKTSGMLREGTQTDTHTKVVQHLPGDIVVTVNCVVSRYPDGTSSAEVKIDATEAQTDGSLASMAFPSGEYHTQDAHALANYAIAKISSDFFNQLEKSFNDMVMKGREVRLELTLAENVDWDFDSDSPATGNFFLDTFEEWLRENSFQSGYSMDTHTDKFIGANLNVPLWDTEKNRSFTLNNFGSNLRRFLKAELGDEYKPKITAMGQKILVNIE